MVACEIVFLYTSAAILGFCCLFAYNSFLSSPSYLEHYFQFAAVKSTDNVSTLPAAKTPSFWNNISTWVTVLMLVPMFLMQFVILTPWVLRQNVQARMIVGAGFSLVAVLLVPVVAASGGVSEGASIAVLIITCILCGAATTTLESALYTFFGSLPTRFMTGFVMGGGFSGSVNSVLRIVITVGLPSTFSGVKTSAVIFFSIGMGLMVLTISLVLLMRWSPLVRSYCPDYRRAGDIARSAHAEAAEKNRLHTLTNDADNSDSAPVAVAAHDTSSANEEVLATSEGLQKMEASAIDNRSLTIGERKCSEPTFRESDGPIAPTEEEEEEEGDPSVFVVSRKMWMMMICLTGNMFTSLVLFPGIGLNAMHVDATASTSTGTDNDTTWGAEAIMPMVIILMFNGGDTIGRLIVNFHRLWVPKFVVPYIVVARAIACVIPLALGLCTPRVINSDVNPIVVFLVLGITNGYLIGLTMAYGTSDPSLTKKERTIAGACMCFALLVGTTLGSVLSLIVVTQAL